MRNTILQGDCLTVLKTLPDRFVQSCVTSPPYYGLRNYGVEGQIGLEETPEAYVQKLVEVFSEVKRVLRDDGVLWLNLGDSYAHDTKGSGGGWANDPTKYASKAQKFTPHKIDHGLKPKNLIGIPWRVAFALQSDGWILRSACIWHKPNAMPESVKDRPTTDYEHVFLLAKSERYFYDSDAIREEAVKGSANAGKRNYIHSLNGRSKAPRNHQEASEGRNKRTVWSIPTVAYSETHFATFPPKLAETCILASSRPDDIVLDPFSGAGTALMVATRLGRAYLGIELNPEYIKLAEKRIAKELGLWEVVA